MFCLALVLLLGVSADAQNSVTCEGLGEFTDDPPFHNMPLPHCPEELETDLHLEYYTRNNIDTPESVIGIDRTTIPSVWSPDKNTAFVVHGWTNDIDSSWMQGFKNDYLEFFDYNIVLVGWGGPYGAGDINYRVSAATTRTIGAHLGEVIENLIVNGGASPDSFHLVGHSLGSHVSGHAGRWLSTNYGNTIGRITGMDPAGPAFVGIDDRTVGLYTDCAAFVDTLNTDNIYGSTPTNTGHQNYYPNGGEEQPGCDNAENTCSHLRAIRYFQESLNQSCIFAARQSCTNSSDIPGSCTFCGGICGAMGYPASGYEDGIYYLTTNSESPFCRG